MSREDDLNTSGASISVHIYEYTKAHVDCFGLVNTSSASQKIPFQNRLVFLYDFTLVGISFFFSLPKLLSSLTLSKVTTKTLFLGTEH